MTQRARSAGIAILIALGVGVAIPACEVSPEAHSLNLSSARAFVNSIAKRIVRNNQSAHAQGRPVRFGTIDYTTGVINAGAPDAYTAFITDSQTVTVYPSSAARILTFAVRPLTFPEPSDRQRWEAAGSPALTHGDSGKTLSAPPGQFTFVLQGTPLTYRQASDLSGTTTKLSAQILSHLRPYTRTYPPATLMLKQLAYLIAIAPLSAAAQSAAWHLSASLPGLHLCGSGVDLAGRHGQGLCVDAQGQETEVLVSTTTGSVLAIEQRLKRSSPWYPTVSTGSLIQSITILSSAR